MKNRYGMDGLSFSLKADTSRGHFEVFPYNADLDDDESTFTPNVQTNAYDTDVDAHTKRIMAEKLKQNTGLFEFERK